MVELSQNLTFYRKAPQNLVRIRATLKYLDRDLLLKLSISSFAKINCSHAAATELFDNYVSADSFAYPIWLLGPESGCGEFSELFQGIRIACKKGLSLAQQHSIVGTRFTKGSGASLRRTLLQRIRENLF
jgi:hypothetical protein